MTRGARRYLVVLVLLLTSLGCTARHTPSPTPTTPAPATAAMPSPVATPTAGSGRLPAVLTRLSFADPQGDAYQPQAAAFDEQGRAYVACYFHGQPVDAPSALVIVDPARNSRGPALTLPGKAVGTPAVRGGRAYVAYQDEGYHIRLAILDPANGQVLTDVAADNLMFGAPLAVGADRLYALTSERLEVRDVSTLRLIETLPLVGQSGERTFLYDAREDRLFVAVADSLYAYQASTLQPLWQQEGVGDPIRHLLLDVQGRHLYAHIEGYHGDTVQAHLLAFDASTGAPQEAIAAPAGSAWQLVGADSASGRLIFHDLSGPGRLWLAGRDGQPLGPSLTLSGNAQALQTPAGHLLLLDTLAHRVTLYDGANLHLLGEVALGYELRNFIADPVSGYVYVNDSAGRVHAIETSGYTVQGSVAAGSGPLTLDAANHLLFVVREPEGNEVAVVDTLALTVTAVITGGNAVAVDSAGRRAFVGQAPRGYEEGSGEVQVWDTRTFQHLGAIARRGAPAYNPLRNEIYLQDYSAYIVDGQTLQVKGELTPDISAQPLAWCNGCLAAGSITVVPEQDLVVVGIEALSAGKGPGTLPQPRTFSARTLEPVTHTATILTLPDAGHYLILPPERGLVYERQRYARYVTMNAALVYTAGSTEPQEVREGLSLDLYLPGSQVILSLVRPAIWAYDARTWEFLGWIPYAPIRAMDPAARRLYAWEGSQLTVLSFEGGAPASAQPPTSAPEGPWGESIQEIHLSPGFADDGTAFMVVGARLLRTRDGGTTWQELHGLPPVPSYSTPSYTLALSPDFDRDHTLFAAGYAGDYLGFGVWRSRDGGDHWQPVQLGLGSLLVSRLAISPRFAGDQALLAYCRYNHFWSGDAGGNLYRSDDAGDHWTLVASHSDMTSSPPLPEPDSLWQTLPEALQFRTGNYGQQLERSTDGGQTWTTVLQPAQPGMLILLRSPGFATDNTLYVLAPYQIYRSTDAGATWQAATGAEATRPANAGPDFTAMDVGEEADGHDTLFLGDRLGQLAILRPDQLEWVSLEPPPGPIPTATPCSAGAERLGNWPQEQIGCSVGPIVEAPMAWQGFDHGLMIWRGDEPQVYVLDSDQGQTRWRSYIDTWQEGQPESDPNLVPPPDRQQPIRGFGKVWREQIGGAESILGWAVGSEEGYTGRWQAFERGLVITGPDGQLYALLNDGSWASP